VPSSTSPLSLITAEHQLNRETLVAERRRHEISFMAKAVRQRGHTLTMLTFNDKTFKHFVEEGPTLRESLLLHLSSLGVAVTTSTLTAGVNRQVRPKFAILEPSLKHLVAPPRQRTRPQFVWQQRRLVINPLFSCSPVNHGCFLEIPFPSRGDFGRR
jgi:hypothetical protein